jgi:hypothetical protein
MNNGLGFVFFVLAPLFGLWPVGCVVGLAIVAIRHALLRKSPPDYAYFFLNGTASSAVVIEFGFWLVLANGRDTDVCMRYAWTTAGVSALTWILWAALASLSGLRRMHVWAMRLQLVACLVLGVLIAMRIHQNMSGSGLGD